MARSHFGLMAVLALGCGGSVKPGSEGAPPNNASGGGQSASGGVATGGIATGGIAAGGVAAGGVAAGGVAAGYGGKLATAGAPSAGEAGTSSAPEGGAGPGDPCAGVAAWCTPGERVCDPRLGKLTVCSECGVGALGADGADCVRLLVSDKESNGVCVVRGQTTLECWPGWGAPRTGQVPPSTTGVFLPDDYSALGPDDLRLCVQVERGAYSCLMNATGCAHGAAGDEGFCAICAGQLHCEGTSSVTQPPVLNQPLLDMTITDMNAIVLSSQDVRFNTEILPLPPAWQGSPSELYVDHQLAGCVRTGTNELGCWLSSKGPIQSSAWHGHFRKLVLTTLPQACVLDEQGQVACGNILQDTKLERLGEPGMLDLVASNAEVCALSRAGTVSCWRGAAALEVPQGW